MMSMGLEDYLVDLLLIAVVVRQLRGRTLTAVGLLWPVPLVAWAGVEYLHALPTSGHDLAAVLTGAGAGLGLGAGCAVLTTLTRQLGGTLTARATGAAAALWIIGMGSRMAFGLYATHGGAPAIARASAHLGITDATTWTATLLLMSLSEVLARAAVLAARAHRTTTTTTP